MTPLAIAHELKVTPGTVTGTLNPLEEMGLIERLRGTVADRRVVHLRLTAKGRTVMRRWLASSRELIEERVSSLTDAEKRRLIKLLAKIAPRPTGRSGGTGVIHESRAVWAQDAVTGSYRHTRDDRATRDQATWNDAPVRPESQNSIEGDFRDRSIHGPVHLRFRSRTFRWPSTRRGAYQ